MICPNCKSQNQDDRFCGHCGNQLKAPCPKCKQWERLGITWCERDLKEAKIFREKFMEEHLGPTKITYEKYEEAFGFYLLFLFLCIMLWMFLLPVFYKVGASGYSWLAGMAMGMTVLISLSTWRIFGLARLKKKCLLIEKEARERFLSQFLDYAKLIKKAEGEAK